MRLPKDIEDIIFEYHDEYNLIERKLTINFIINQSYKNWLRDAGFYSSFFAVNEWDCKHDIYPFISGRVFICNAKYWQFFLNYFTHCEKFIRGTKCLPSCYYQG